MLVKPGQLTPYYLVLEDGTLTNGGLLFSDNCEVYQSSVFRTRWNGFTKTDAINDAEYSGNLLYLLKMMRGFIKSNAAKRWFKLPDYRLNFPEYAERAILECCVNLIHRDMTEVGSEVHVDIYDDQADFRTPALYGRPYADFRIRCFFTTVHSVLYGRSDEDFQRVIDQESAENEGSEETSPKTSQKTNPKREKTNPKTSPETNPKSPAKPLGKTAQAILDMLSEDPYMKREDLMAKFDLTLAGVKYHLANLQKEKYLLRIEGRKSGRWKVLVKK